MHPVSGVTISGTDETARTNEGDVINDARDAPLFDKFGPSMIAEKPHNRLIDLIDQPDASRRSGAIAHQIRYLP